MDSSDNVNVLAVEMELEAALNNPRYYADQFPNLGPAAAGSSWGTTIEAALASATGAVGAGLSYAEHARLEQEYTDALPTAGAWRRESRDPEGFLPAEPIRADAAGSGTSRSFTHMSTGINSSDLPNMQPSKGTKRSSTVEIQTDVSNKKKKKTTTKVSTGSQTVASKTISSAQSYYDSHLLLNSGEKRLTKLNLKLGKQLYPDTRQPFLDLLNGSGTVRMQWAGRCVTSADGFRHNHIQMFRHRLAQDNSFNTGAIDTTNSYPSTFAHSILFPANTNKFYPSGGSTGAYFPANTTPFRDITDGQTYWSPYNLADLEDCSWNLNNLKFQPLPWYSEGLSGNPIVDTPIPPNVQPFRKSTHYRQSILAYNNSKVAVAADAVPATTRPATYTYKACIHKGSVTYDFMNKGAGGAKVEIIVYRTKKNQNLQFTPQTGTVGDFTYANLAIQGPISQGYLDTCMAKQGTDNLVGRLPLAADVVTNANFPLLPKLRATKQGNLPFAEVARQTFAMPSGGRREVTFTFPGLFYDPMNQIHPSPSTFDEYSYALYISVCGTVCTDEMKATPTDGTATAYNVGDLISRADVQFYATYTETMGACVFQKKKAPIMFSRGTLIDTKLNSVVGGDVTETPVVILEQGSAVRLPQNSSLATSYPGVNLGLAFNTV